MRKRADSPFLRFKESVRGTVKTKKHHLKKGPGPGNRRHSPVNEQKIVDQVGVLAKPGLRVRGSGADSC